MVAKEGREKHVDRVMGTWGNMQILLFLACWKPRGWDIWLWWLLDWSLVFAFSISGLTALGLAVFASFFPRGLALEPTSRAMRKRSRQTAVSTVVATKKVSQA